MYRVCGHCHQKLSEKALKEHERLYLEDGVWLTESKIEQGVSSSEEMSEPITISDPPDPHEEVPEPLAVSSEGEFPFEDVEQNSEEDSGQEGEEVEYWAESDDELKNDCGSEPEPLLDNLELRNLGDDQESAVWWIIAFTCVMQTLHSMSLRSVEFLLKFLAGLLTFLGRYSTKIAEIASAFPRSVNSRSKFLEKTLCLVPVATMVVCLRCHSLYNYLECIKKRGSITYAKHCTKCDRSLLREIVTRNGNKRFYPHALYPHCSLIDALKSFFSRHGFIELCGSWHSSVTGDSDTFSDVYSGRIWKEFMYFDGREFLSNKNNIAFMLNIDWFKPYKHRTYSTGVMYLVFMNLPRNIRFKRENVILIGLIPGPSEPPLHINSYLTPLVADLLSLWRGIPFEMGDKTIRNVRCALLCVACDIPAGKKVCGFLSHVANLGYSKCYCTFSTGVFGKNCYAGFDRDSWLAHTNEKHRRDISEIRKTLTKTEKQRKESECRYSCLLQLPYFDPVRMLILDPMHNLYIGTSKTIIGVWIKQGILRQSDLKIMNSRIACIVIPTNVSFSALPPTVEHTSFTAEQMMIWVNYYSLYCLYELLPQNHYECWRHFVLASRLLSKRCITANEVSIADRFLLQFCCRVQNLYGDATITPNMHMHGHLADSVLDFGPTASFWLFSFERYNGILGDQPTNNCSIEVQLMNRFMLDNSHLHLINMARESNIVFDHIVKEHAFSFHSTRHLDDQISRSNQSSSGFHFSLSQKYKIAFFTFYFNAILLDVYSFLYPGYSEQLRQSDFILPRSYKKMFSVTVQDQKFSSGQCVLARSVFPICSHSQSSPATIFFDPSLHALKIDYFFVHSFEMNDVCITHSFVVVHWFLCHPKRHEMGHPLQIWHQTYEHSPQSTIIPLDYISCPVLTASLRMDEQLVLVIIPTV